MHHSDHDGVVRISVARPFLRAVRFDEVIYLPAQFFPYQECNYGYSAKTLQLKLTMVYIQMVRREEVSNACDVYSYGVLLREIITHEMPAVNMGKIYEGKTEVGYASLAMHDIFSYELLLVYE